MKLDIQRIRENKLSIDFTAKKLVEGFITGLHKSPYHGFSVEFAEHKIYNTGESTRFIDWKLFAKTDRLYTKSFEEETNLRCHILLDISSSMHYPKNGVSKLYFATYASAALSWLLFKQRDAVALTTFSNTIKLRTQVKSTQSHLQKLFGALEHVLLSQKPTQSTNLPHVLHTISNTIHKRSLVLLFSDMINNLGNEKEIEEALMHLKHTKNDIIIFHILDKKTELEFNFSEAPHVFIDLETNEKVKLKPNEIKSYYLQQTQKRTDVLKLLCGNLKIELVEVDVQTDINEVLNSFLIKRTKLT